MQMRASSTVIWIYVLLSYFGMDHDFIYCAAHKGCFRHVPMSVVQLVEPFGLVNNGDCLADQYLASLTAV